ncbi:hypothetical protein [Prosthecobacter sp.]|uniref:hypothetical protein n=1 Tax=Prosthecobacter sp. TaxID=1965333 RepID=UPI0037843DCC
MPATKNPPSSSSTRVRRKTLKPRVTAAVSIDEDLYTQSLAKAKTDHDNNWSGYVRFLVKKDLGQLN